MIFDKSQRIKDTKYHIIKLLSIIARPERMPRIPATTKVVNGTAEPNVTITAHVRVPLGTRLHQKVTNNSYIFVIL